MEKKKEKRIDKITKSDRFKKIASKRMQNVLLEMTRLNNCSNTHRYEYSRNDVRKMMSTLRDKVKEISASYEKGLNKNQAKFKF